MVLLASQVFWNGIVIVTLPHFIHYRDINEICIKRYPCYAKYVFIVPNLILYSQFAALISSK